ncbi:metallophosphoesterase [Pedobacter sp. Leaf216]|uniref:metallophosphoesterase family protein n=1 Tax=Pedobacter sp. Leaf216 TaxID=1735684 RepID=UPI0006F2EF2D|nr:metallophosphoesterase [Pedobacter sp. Leaf216]KQM75251.1 metallophosphoesterase [Pedobacter sp. Leaf216]
MVNELNRRRFITTLGTLAAALPLGASAFDFIPSPGKSFDFILLGDLHFDKLEHHDMEYIKTTYPNDLGQIKNYSRITEENLPLLMRIAKEKAIERNADFFLQLGDFVEGLCGSEELAKKQIDEFVELVRQQDFKRPFFVIKGNHDITGKGARENYVKTVLPWQGKEQKQLLSNANSTFVHKNSRFVLFDSYSAEESLIWLKSVLKNHTEKNLFFCIHQPVVPFDARANWHVFSGKSQQASRNELLDLLGEHNAIVLCGHLHKTSILTRATSKGNFVQLCIGSVIPSAQAAVTDHLTGLEAYQTNLVDLEPEFSPGSLDERKRNLTNEKPFIKHFEYANFCGYGNVSVDAKSGITLSIYANLDQKPWSIVNLSNLLKL